MKTERSDLTYVVKDPEVFKSGETYLVFGEAEQARFNILKTEFLRYFNPLIFQFKIFDL